MPTASRRQTTRVISGTRGASLRELPRHTRLIPHEVIELLAGLHLPEQTLDRAVTLELLEGPRHGAHRDTQQAHRENDDRIPHLLEARERDDRRLAELG